MYCNSLFHILISMHVYHLIANSFLLLSRSSVHVNNFKKCRSKTKTFGIKEGQEDKSFYYHSFYINNICDLICNNKFYNPANRSMC